jgi:hypothetical protein
LLKVPSDSLQETFKKSLDTSSRSEGQDFVGASVIATVEDGPGFSLVVVTFVRFTVAYVRVADVLVAIAEVGVVAGLAEVAVVVHADVAFVGVVVVVFADVVVAGPLWIISTVARRSARKWYICAFDATS